GHPLATAAAFAVFVAEYKQRRAEKRAADVRAFHLAEAELAGAITCSPLSRTGCALAVAVVVGAGFVSEAPSSFLIGFSQLPGALSPDWRNMRLPLCGSSFSR